VQTYQRRLEQHLSRYRRNRLGIAQSGTFKYRGHEKSYGHILPRELRWLNVPEPFRLEVRDYVSRERHIHLHKYFHHLNSSQAFALNLFFPYFAHARPRLAGALGAASIDRWSFEVVPDSNEGTNVDVFWTGKDGAATFCEVKLSEASFGKARNDKRHHDKLSSLYRPRLAGLVAPSLLEPKEFFDAYQILRNLWLGAGNSRSIVIFLLPEDNKLLCAELNKVLALISPQLRARTYVVHIEVLLSKLASPTFMNGELGWYAALLREKYLP